MKNVLREQETIEMVKMAKFFINKNQKYQYLFDSYGDFLQEMVISLMEASPKFDENKGNKSTFLYSVMQNKIKQIIRSKNFLRNKAVTVSIEKNISNTNNEMENIMLKDILEDEENIEYNYIEKEIIKKIKSMLNKYSYDYYILELNQSEIANKYNISQAKISRQINNNIKEIKIELGE